MKVIEYQYDIKIKKTGPDQFEYEMDENSKQIVGSYEVDVAPQMITTESKKLADEFAKQKAMLKGQIMGTATEFSGKITKKVLS